MADYKDYYDFSESENTVPVDPRDEAWRRFCELSDEAEQLRSTERDILKRLKDVTEAREKARVRVIGYVNPVQEASE